MHSLIECVDMTSEQFNMVSNGRHTFKECHFCKLITEARAWTVVNICPLNSICQGNAFVPFKSPNIRVMQYRVHPYESDLVESKGGALATDVRSQSSLHSSSFFV
jgi:hypothetical protein